MSDCEGNGKCIEQCSNGKYHTEDDVNSSHRLCCCGYKRIIKLEGNTDCKHNCKLVECNTYKVCSQKLPQWHLDLQNGMCVRCVDMFKGFKFLNEKFDCSKCLIKKEVVDISCGKHKVCLECLKDLFKTQGRNLVGCPFCSKSI